MAHSCLALYRPCAPSQCPITAPLQEDNEAYLSAEEGPRASMEGAGAEADEEEEEQGSGDETPGALHVPSAQRRLSIGAAGRGRRTGSSGAGGLLAGLGRAALPHARS